MMDPFFSVKRRLGVSETKEMYSCSQFWEIVFVSELKVVMRGQPLHAPMDEWTGCRKPAYERVNGISFDAQWSLPFADQQNPRIYRIIELYAL